MVNACGIKCAQEPPSYFTLIVWVVLDIGKAKLFKLNEENTAVMELVDVYKKLLQQVTEDYFKKKMKVEARVVLIFFLFEEIIL